MPPQNAQREAADREAIQQRAGKDEAVALDMTREAAMAFLDADADGDHLLDYEEFRMAVPEKMRGQSAEAALRELFATADADGSGQISMSEFFMWTLTIAQSHGGNGLEAVFKRFDRDARGELDSEEFSAACEEMGFGELAGEMFVELDHDDSGTISYSELMGILKGRAHLVSKDCKRFLTTLAFDAAKPSAGGEPRAGSLEAVAQVTPSTALHSPPEALHRLPQASAGIRRLPLTRTPSRLDRPGLGAPRRGCRGAAPRAAAEAQGARLQGELPSSSSLEPSHPHPPLSLTPPSATRSLTSTG